MQVAPISTCSRNNALILPGFHNSLSAQVAKHKAATGVQLVDVLDVHYYPQASGVTSGWAVFFSSALSVFYTWYVFSNEDLATGNLRLRSVKVMLYSSLHKFAIYNESNNINNYYHFLTSYNYHRPLMMVHTKMNLGSTNQSILFLDWSNGLQMR